MPTLSISHHLSAQFKTTAATFAEEGAHRHKTFALASEAAGYSRLEAERATMTRPNRTYAEVEYEQSNKRLNE